jgi:hypothetical protein
MATNYAALARVLLDVFFALSELANKTKEERDEMYNESKRKFDALEDPLTLKDTE